MQHIDYKFKDNDPKATVEKICGILDDLGIKTETIWHDSGIDYCYSLTVTGEKGSPRANGKGVSADFAHASAYGEFIERMQGGLFLYKYQSLTHRPGMDTHAYAPDVKYMTVDELVENGEWMDYLIEAYPHPLLSRRSIAEQCLVYSGSQDGRVLTVPFYSLFEDRYVYLPMGFVDQIYATNGCCAGNTREEAWVHAFSEIMERYATIRLLVSGCAVPRIPEETLKKFPAVDRIISQLREEGDIEVDVFDCSFGYDIPVIATRFISKKYHSYQVKLGADPVLEIAIQRTLTEMLQGTSIHKVARKHGGAILKDPEYFGSISNVINQLETGSGFFSADFFADELVCHEKATEFTDNCNKSNKELLQYMMDMYRKIGKPVYVRNFSYLGFPSYRFVVPGISEAYASRLHELVPEYAIGDETAKTMRNVAAATDDELSWMMSYHQIISGTMGRYPFFNRLSGVPLSGYDNDRNCAVTRAYASYRLNRFQDAIRYMKGQIAGFDKDSAEYFTCVNKYLEYRINEMDEEKIRSILYKFFAKQYPDRLYQKLEAGLTPYDDYLVRCDFTSCQQCKHSARCAYTSIQQMTEKVGAVYKTFVHGQDRSEFSV